jgi:hypothetical protein
MNKSDHVARWLVSIICRAAHKKMLSEENPTRRFPKKKKKLRKENKRKKITRNGDR